MRQNLIFIVFLFTSLSVFSQIPRSLEIPKESPRAEVRQRVGFTDILVVYHSPSLKGRDVWNSGVIPKQGIPYPWRAGANQNTTITFTDSVIVEGNKLKAGTYGLHIIPIDDEMTIIFSNNYTSWGSFFYNQDEDALRVKVKKEKTPVKEWLTYDFDVREKNHAVLSLKWDEVKVSFKIEVDKQTTLNHIRNQLRSDASFNSEGWSNAAQYCLDNNHNYEEALNWIERSLRNEKKFKSLLIKANLLMRLERKDDLNTIKKEALDISNARNLFDYVFQNRDNDDLSFMHEAVMYNLNKNPKTWEANYGAGIYFSQKGNLKKAKTYLYKALKNADKRVISWIERDMNKLEE